MQTKTLVAHSPPLLQNPNLFFTNPPHFYSTPRFNHTPPGLPKLHFSTPLRRRNRFATSCIGDGVLIGDNGSHASPVSEEVEVVEVKREELESKSTWDQMKEIAVFTGPATGLWLCGPLMSLIDTVVIGQGSSIELAALG